MFFDDFWMIGGLEVGLDGGFVEVLSDGRHPDTCLLYTSPSPRDA